MRAVFKVYIIVFRFCTFDRRDFLNIFSFLFFHIWGTRATPKLSFYSGFNNILLKVKSLQKIPRRVGKKYGNPAIKSSLFCYSEFDMCNVHWLWCGQHIDFQIHLPTYSHSHTKRKIEKTDYQPEIFHVDQIMISRFSHFLRSNSLLS